MQHLVTAFWILVFSILAAGALVGFVEIVGCRSSLSVNMKQYQCSSRIENEDGSVDFRDCIKGDGTGDTVKSQGGQGDDRVDIDPKLQGILPTLPKERVN